MFRRTQLSLSPNLNKKNNENLLSSSKDLRLQNNSSVSF